MVQIFYLVSRHLNFSHNEPMRRHNEPLPRGSMQTKSQAGLHLPRADGTPGLEVSISDTVEP